MDPVQATDGLVFRVARDSAAGPIRRRLDLWRRHRSAARCRVRSRDDAGYRADLFHRLSIDVTLFSSRYRHLETSEPGAAYFAETPGPPHVVLPYYFSSLGYANDYGVEFFARWNATKHWQISPGYSYLDMISSSTLRAKTRSIADSQVSPKHQFQVRSNLSLPHDLEWDTSLYYVSELWAGPVPAYARCDTRVGWRAEESLEISVSGQNLLAPRHVEFWTPFPGVIPTYAQRSVFAKITYRF
jgi:iron complex outermembrane receptor protein